MSNETAEEVRKLRMLIWNLAGCVFAIVVAIVIIAVIAYSLWLVR